jgi:gluconolactonase
MRMKKIVALAFFTITIHCQTQSQNKTVGRVERIDAALDAIIAPGAKAEIIAEGFNWSEGPLWLEKINALIFSDVPENKIYKWTAAKGKELYLTPSGYTDTVIKRGGEMGSNGLLLDNKGRLVLCQDGNRQMGRMNAPLDHPAPNFITIASTYKGKRFSSPNDAVYNKAGELFFTDPPYGLETQSDNDPKKEISFNGVYKVKKDGTVILLIDSLPRPNGIAFLPGEKKLLIACSDGRKPNWYVYDVNGDALTNGKIFYSTAGSPKGEKGGA